MKFGLSESQYEQLSNLVFEPLKKQGAAVYVFGSRAIGQHHPFSDIDILYALPPDSVLAAGWLSNLREQMENSNFPFIVELVDEKDLADSYRPGVERQRRRV